MGPVAQKNREMWGGRHFRAATWLSVDPSAARLSGVHAARGPWS